MSHDADGTCACVVDHSPVPVELHVHHVHPLYAGGPDTAANKVWICPTSHVAVHELLRAYERAGGLPAWETRRRFGRYVRDLAARAWAEMQPLTP